MIIEQEKIYKVFTFFLKVSPTIMPFITLHGEHDNRLGSHIVFYLNQIFYACKNRYEIRYNTDKLPYLASPFIQMIVRFVDNYNISLRESGNDVEEEGDEVFPFYKEFTLDWSKMMYKTLETIRVDFAAYWRDIYPEVCSDCFSYVSPRFSIPFDPKKTIAVHLRLDDVYNWGDYNGTTSANYYRDLIQRDASIDEMGHVHNSEHCPNIQAPISPDRVEMQIQDAKLRYPDHEVVIISSPKTRALIQTNYRIICNEDESHDLFLLCVSDVVVLSRSTFAICSLLFGNHSRVYVPLWGQLTYYGFYTKFHRDSEHFSYFW